MYTGGWRGGAPQDCMVRSVAHSVARSWHALLDRFGALGGTLHSQHELVHSRTSSLPRRPYIRWHAVLDGFDALVAHIWQSTKPI